MSKNVYHVEIPELHRRVMQVEATSKEDAIKRVNDHSEGDEIDFYPVSEGETWEWNVILIEENDDDKA